jgi:hypothetical protein
MISHVVGGFSFGTTTKVNFTLFLYGLVVTPKENGYKPVRLQNASGSETELRLAL